MAQVWLTDMQASSHASARCTPPHRTAARRARDFAVQHSWPLGTAIVAIALVAYRTLAAMQVGPRWDSFAFLANAAAIAGKGFGYTEPARAPLLSLLTALPLLAFPLDERVIQVVDAAVTLAGLAGLYLLVRRRLTQPAAAVATLALLGSPALWEWVGIGYTDIAAVGLCAWALLLFVKATEDDPRWYLGAFSTLLAATLMRTSSVLLVTAVVVWLIMRARPFRQARHIAGGIGLALAAYVPFGIAYMRLVGEPFYPFVASRAIQDAGSGPGVVQQVESFLGSLHVLAAPSQVAGLTVVALALAATGLVWGSWRHLREDCPGVGRVGAAVAVLALAVYVARAAGPMAAQVAIAGGVFFVWRMLASDEVETAAGIDRTISAPRALDAAMLVWLLSFWWFHEEWAQRVVRYYITMAPGVVYFAALGWRELVRAAVDLPLVDVPRRRGVIRAVGAGAVALAAAAIAVNVVTTPWTPDPELADARATSEWLAHNAADGAVIYSDQWPATAFYLGRDVEAMPLFAEEPAVSHELAKNGADYFVSNDGLAVPHFGEAFATDTLRVLAQAPATSRGQRVSHDGGRESADLLYLGAGWENYLEELDGYRVRLAHDEGDYNIEGSAFLDAYSRSELASRDAVAVYGVRWHDRANAQRAVEDFVVNGGTLLVDASRNMHEPVSLDGSILFDTVIRREPVAPDARVTLDRTFAASHPELGEIDTSRFVDENGGPWYGAGYDELPGSTPLRVLARLDGRPLVAERAWGRGRVVWVGYNLFWHAHLSDNAGEARLVRAVLDEVLGRGPEIGRLEPDDPRS